MCVATWKRNTFTTYFMGTLKSNEDWLTNLEAQTTMFVSVSTTRKQRCQFMMTRFQSHNRYNGRVLKRELVFLVNNYDKSLGKKEASGKFCRIYGHMNHDTGTWQLLCVRRPHDVKQDHVCTKHKRYLCYARPKFCLGLPCDSDATPFLCRLQATETTRPPPPPASTPKERKLSNLRTTKLVKCSTYVQSSMVVSEWLLIKSRIVWAVVIEFRRR